MKHNLATWGHGSMDDERVANDIYRMTEGSVELDLNKFKFSKKTQNNVAQENNNKKRRKK